MPKSTSKPRGNKPKKPYPEFPLFAHNTGRWAKKISGRLIYFGRWATVVKGKMTPVVGDGWESAHELYKQQIADIKAGRTPSITVAGSLTVSVLVDLFLNRKRKKVEEGAISQRTFHDYYSTCNRIVKQFGSTREVAKLDYEDFQDLRASLQKTRGPIALGNELQRVKTVFKSANKNDRVPMPFWGDAMDKPTRSTERKHRSEREAENGKRMFEAAELRTIIDAADHPMKAMILLGVNCGFGQTDVSRLRNRDVKETSEWIDYARPKTGVRRRCALWPETVAAIKDAIAKRPEKPKHDADKELIFLTRCAQSWVKLNTKGTPADALGQEFAKLLKRLKLKRPGLSFYGLRHTFRTIADETKDFPAVDMVMGHARDDMGSRYVEKISDERLKDVTDRVRRWLFPEQTAPQS